MSSEPKLPFHDVFTLTRLLKAPPARVFAAFRDIDLKSKWFIAPGDYQIAERSLDFRVGGKEVLRGKFDNGTTTSYDATYYDITDNERIIYAYDLLINGSRFSVTLATILFRAKDGGTELSFTEQNVYVNAPADAHASRIKGVAWHLDNLDQALRIK